ncbi:hypothetical protein DFH29DRAFT_875725 [Suillus ampliporus]|nr:hypothetical protein DFH29DRAFT_875725 [Suillus ampliporus]
MPQITAHINKKHKSLLDHDSDLDTSAEDDIQMEEDGQDHEEEDNDHETIEFHNNNELGEPAKIPTPPPTVLKKRKRGQSPDPEPPTAKEITFITSITSAAEMKKPLSKYTSRNKSFVLNLNKPWDTMKAQILIKISDVLNPRHLSYDDYEVSWFIPHVLLQPGLSLLSQDYFNGLMKQAANLTSKDPTVNITVIQKNEHKENEALVADTPPATNDKAKKRVGMIFCVFCVKKQLQFFLEIKTRSRTYETFESTGFAKSQMLLVYQHIATLIRAQMSIFPSTLNDLIAGHLRYPVLQQWIDAQNAKVSSTPAPVFNFTIRNEILGLFRPEGSMASTIPAAAASNTPSDPACTTLLHPSCTQGRDIPLNMFCVEYDLGDNIRSKLINNAYKEAQFLCFITIAELKEMGFQLGEIAAICDAVERWSVSCV